MFSRLMRAGNHLPVGMLDKVIKNASGLDVVERRGGGVKGTVVERMLKWFYPS